MAALLLLVGWIWLFTRPKTQKFVLLLENAGWFHAGGYKSNQGQKVRRATIFGILLLTVAGIWTLISHGTLRKGSPDLTINIPFTGQVIIGSNGDAKDFLAQLPASAKTRVRILSPGSTTLQPRQIVRLNDYKSSVDAVLDANSSAASSLEASKQEAGSLKPGTLESSDKEALKKAENEDVVVFLEKINDILYAKMKAMLKAGVFPEDSARRLREVDQRTDMADLSELIAAFERETEKKEFVRVEESGDSTFVPGQVVPRDKYDAVFATLQSKKGNAGKVALPKAIPTKPSHEDVLGFLGSAFRLPTAVLVIDRYELREANEKADESQNVKIGIKGDINLVAPFNKADKPVKEGEIVSRADFDAAVARLEAEKSKGRDRELPRKAALVPATGTTMFESVTLLPSVQFTVPLLLLALSLWLAWRIVNMPTFADFLIATEAELNKVSWTTQKRLVQDTIVVLATVVLMSLFLFGMDWTWKVVLSWDRIGVLHIPKDQSDTEKKIEQKRW